MKQVLFTICFLVASFVFSLGKSPSPFEMEAPVMTGSGCKAEDSSAFLVQEDGLIRLQFSKLTAESVQYHVLDRKNCNISIPVRVSSGYRIASPVVRLSGIVETNEDAAVSLSAEGFFTGQQGVVVKMDFEQNGKIQFSNEGENNLVWSVCGQATNVRLNLSLMTKSSNQNEKIKIKIEDGTILPLKWKRC